MMTKRVLPTYSNSTVVDLRGLACAVMDAWLLALPQQLMVFSPAYSPLPRDLQNTEAPAGFAIVPAGWPRRRGLGATTVFRANYRLTGKQMAVPPKSLGKRNNREVRPRNRSQPESLAWRILARVHPRRSANA